MSSIIFDAFLNTKDFDAALARMNRSVGSWAQETQRQANGIDETMQKVGGAMGAYFSAQALMGFGKEVIRVRGEFQQLGIAFETMLGNKDKADKLMQDAVQFAAKTPFTLTDVAQNIKLLMAMGIETDNVMSTMKALGDVAAGVSQPIGRIAMNYGQVATMGKLQGRELRDFAMAGIPLVDELAKNLHKEKQEIEGMVSAGKIGFPLVAQAFQTMSGEGGKFFNLMEKQSMSVTGQLSNLQDKWDVMLNAIGKSNEGIIYTGIAGLTALISEYKTIIEVLTEVAIVLGAVKVATMFVAYEQKVQAASYLVLAQTSNIYTAAEARAIVMKERSAVAQKALNESMLLNPWVMAAAGVTVLAIAIYKLATYQTDLEKSLNKTDVEIENEKDKALELFSALKVTKEGTEQWVKARKDIIDQYGQYLPAQVQELRNLGQIQEAQKLVNEAIRENAAVKTLNDVTQQISAEYNPKIVEGQASIVKKVERELTKERAALAKQELAGIVAMYKSGDANAPEAFKQYRQKLMAEVGSINKEGLATSFDAANMAGIFNTLEGAIKGLKLETDLADNAYKGYMTGITTLTPTAGETIVKSIDQQRAAIQGEIASSKKKLAEMEATPSDYSTKAIEDQQKQVKKLENDLIKVKQNIQKQVTEAKQQLKTLEATPTEGSEKLIKDQKGYITGLEGQLKKLSTAAEERLELQKQLVAEEQKLKDIESSPGENRLKAIEEQDAIIKGIKDHLKVKETVKDLDAQLKTQQDLLTKAVTDGNLAEAKAITTKVEALKEELMTRERLAETIQNVFAYESATPLTVQGMKTTGSVGYNLTKKPGASKPLTQEEMTQEMWGLRKNQPWIDENNKKVEDQHKKLLDQQLVIRRQILESVTQLAGIMGELVGLTEDENQSLGNLMQGFSQGGFIGYLSAFLGEFINGIGSIFEKQDIYANKLAYINKLLEKNQQLIEQSFRTGGTKEAYEERIKLLEKEIETITDNFNAEMARAKKKSEKWINAGAPPPSAEAQQQILDDITAKQKAELDAMRQEYQDFISGGVTQNTLADAIAQGFQEGKTSVDDFAGYMNDVLIDAVMNVFKSQFLLPMIDKELTPMINKAMEDNVITPEEKAAIDAKAKEIADRNKIIYEGLTGGLDTGDGTVGSRLGLSGQISRSITEDTGSELAGLFRRYADDQRLVKDYTKVGMMHWAAIEANTLNTVNELQTTNKKLDQVISNTRPTFSGPL